MSDYTPTTETIRARIVSSNYTQGDQPDLGAAFDRWLAAHDAEVYQRGREEGRETFKEEPMSNTRYPIESHDEDDGTMTENVERLADEVVGHRIVKAERVERPVNSWWDSVTEMAFAITLDNGKKVVLADTNDCCAYTGLDNFLLHADRIDHIITGVGTTGGFQRWHIYADLGDVLELEVGWSAGNPFYYGYGFEIDVVDVDARGDGEQA